MKYQTCLSFVVISVLAMGCGPSAKQEEKEATARQDSIQLVNRYREQGDRITGETQKVFLQELGAAMQRGGPEEAVRFCNIRAMPITDSLSEAYNCTISRISENYRNPANRPESDLEQAQLNNYFRRHQMGEPLEPEVYLVEDEVVYFKPISVKVNTCLKCHGEPGKDIAFSTLEMIQEKYPQDQAVNYSLDDFRGSWKVTFSRKQ